MKYTRQQGGYRLHSDWQMKNDRQKQLYCLKEIVNREVVQKMCFRDIHEKKNTFLNHLRLMDFAVSAMLFISLLVRLKSSKQYFGQTNYFAPNYLTQCSDQTMGAFLFGQKFQKFKSFKKLEKLQTDCKKRNVLCRKVLNF